MENTDKTVKVYQLRIWIRRISPQVWRRLLVRSDSTIAQLHDTLQIAFGWMDEHLNQFLIRGKPYGVWQPGGMGFDDNPHQVQLHDFHFRYKETFVYEYDLTDWWQHEIRLEQILPFDPAKQYPLAALFSEHSTPELLCQEVRWASLLSYDVTMKLLGDLLPMEHQLSTSTLSRHVHQVAEHLESELGNEQPSFIEGCPDQWYKLPEPGTPLVVSLDGGYVHARSKESRKDGSFEVIVGKSTTGEGATTRFGLVSGYDSKPRRRLFEVLQAQGLQMNQAITFLTDGGDTVRDLTEGHSPLASHILDWFHVAMRLTVLNQMAKGVLVEHKGEKFEEELERAKWFLWHSNAYKALQLLEWLVLDIITSVVI